MENLVGAAFVTFLAAVFIVPRWRRWRFEKKLAGMHALGKALPRIVTPARGSSPFGGVVTRPKLED